MLDTYKNFEALIPSNHKSGSAHAGEDGRFVENLIRSFLCKYIPKELEVFSGFIVRPAVKTNKNSKTRSNDTDCHSTQLDIIIYDSAKYPIYMRSNDMAIVPPEGVIGIISVKKTLNNDDIKNELAALKEASKLCRIKDKRPPFLALVSMDNNIHRKRPETLNWILKKMDEVYSDDDDAGFDDVVGYIGSIRHWSIFKIRPTKKDPYRAVFKSFRHSNEDDMHLGLQFLLTCIFSVYYDSSRNFVPRPGFTGFPKDVESKDLGAIKVNKKAFISK